MYDHRKIHADPCLIIPNYYIKSQFVQQISIHEVFIIVVADSCTGARKYPNCCNRVDVSACYVPGGNCYCDPLCTLYHDCCNDAEAHLSQCELYRQYSLSFIIE